MTKVNTIQRRVNEANFSANLTRLNIINQSTSGTGEKLPVGKRLPINQSTFFRDDDCLAANLRQGSRTRNAGESRNGVENGRAATFERRSRRVKASGKGRKRRDPYSRNVTCSFSRVSARGDRLVLNFSLDRSSLSLSLFLARFILLRAFKQVDVAENWPRGENCVLSETMKGSFFNGVPLILSLSLYLSFLFSEDSISGPD